MNNVIEIKNLHKKFNKKCIFTDLNINFKKNLKYAIKAPSGYGKSTLINLISGFIYPDSGSISVDGLEMNDDNIFDIRQKISMLPQLTSSISNGTVLDTIMRPFSFKSNEMINPSIDDVSILLEKSGLSAKIANEKFSKISGGEKQRVGIIICKLLNRKILLLDEPTSALDNISSQKMIDLIFDDDVTVIAASHDKYYLDNCNEIINLEEIANESN